MICRSRTIPHGKLDKQFRKEFVDWLPSNGLSSALYARPDQKRQEMALADLVCAPSTFVARTIKEYLPDKLIAHVPYGVDVEFWTPAVRRGGERRLRFIYAGQVSLRKGIPDLICAWKKAQLRDAELLLSGQWMLSEDKLQTLPAGVHHSPPCGPLELRNRYRSADVLVFFPSYFEGIWAGDFGGYGLWIARIGLCMPPQVPTL